LWAAVVVVLPEQVQAVKALVAVVVAVVEFQRAGLALQVLAQLVQVAQAERLHPQPAPPAVTVFLEQ
jgi:hypothetical protein